MYLPMWLFVRVFLQKYQYVIGTLNGHTIDLLGIYIYLNVEN